MATAGVGAPQLAGQIHRSARDDSAAARHSADVLGPRLRAEYCDRDDLLRAAGRSLCVSLGQGLFRYRPGAAGSFDRRPAGAVVHAEPNRRSGQRDLFVPVLGGDSYRTGFPAVHREERYARHDQRRDLRLPADGRRVRVCLRSRRTAKSPFVQRRTFSKARRQYRAADRVASQLHLLQLRVPDDDRLRRYLASLGEAPAACR